MAKSGAKPLQVFSINFFSRYAFCRRHKIYTLNTVLKIEYWNMTAAALSIRNLYKEYENGFQALKGINLEVQPGDFFALLGPNGAGKSTTLGVLCSLVKKSSGEVSIFVRI